MIDFPTFRCSIKPYLFILLLVVSSSVNAKSIVAYHGRLQAANDGTSHFIGSKSGEVVYPAGVGLFWSSAGGDYYNRETVKNLKKQYNVQIIRCAMTAWSPWSDGYTTNPTHYEAQVHEVVEAAIAEGIYVIIDWHCEGNNLQYLDQEKAFFGKMAKKYGDKPNVIYEIWNEPTNQNWSKLLKPFHEAVIAEIRKYDPDNLVLCSAETWSQKLEQVAENPIKDGNVGYVLHFYSRWHSGKYYNGKESLKIPIFVSEWGIPGYHKETAGFVKWMEENKIPNCSWAINNKDESISYFMPNNSNVTGPWSDSDLRESGKILSKLTLEWPGNKWNLKK